MNNIISTFIGMLIAIMLMFNGTLAKAYGNYTASVIIHLVGLIFITIILLLNKSKFNSLNTIPLYLYSGGAIGFFVVLFNNVSFKSLGISTSLALGLLGQSLSSIVIDHYGLMGVKVVKFNKKKLLGLCIIILGIYALTI